MTFNEGWIEVVNRGASQPLDSTLKGLPTFAKLEVGAAGRIFWVPYVQKWAVARGLDIHYIDNCWLHVAVSADQMGAFLRAIPQPGQEWVAPLVDRIDPADTYVIVAEEF